jgi:hypothetical protein
MSKRTEALASRLEQGARELMAFAEKLSEAEWQTVCPNEGRTVGVLVHHVADVYPGEMQVARMLAAGTPLGLTWDGANELNAKHAKDHAYVGKAETLALLRKNSAAAAEDLRQFSDEQLDGVALIALSGNMPFTAQYWIEEHPINHSFRHLISIRAAVSAAI